MPLYGSRQGKTLFMVILQMNPTPRLN